MEDSSKKLSEQLLFKAKNAYDDGAEGTAQKARDYAEGYKAFLDAAKTEREAVKRGIEMAEAEGFRPFRFGEKLERGGKYYYNNCGKSLYLFSLGSEDIERDGIRITAAHVDSPRLDLKQHPLFEEGGFSYFKTHYYGGIKKYQWVTIPLALHGVVVRADGSTVDVCVGEDESDPLFTIPDLLIHLASEQMTQPMNKGIKGENMNLLIGSEPFTDTEVSERVKLETMKLLSERYGITEEDFISAELSAVPAAKARDIGFDRSMVGAYGHDDRVCAYPELTALFECKDSCHTMLVILADKEETGSDGVTGMQSDVLGDVIHAISDAYGASDAAVRAASACLSADVSAAFDPMHADVYDRRNAAVMGGRRCDEQVHRQPRKVRYERCICRVCRKDPPHTRRRGRRMADCRARQGRRGRRRNGRCIYCSPRHQHRRPRCSGALYARTLRDHLKGRPLYDASCALRFQFPRLSRETTYKKRKGKFTL